MPSVKAAESEELRSGEAIKIDEEACQRLFTPGVKRRGHRAVTRSHDHTERQGPNRLSQ